MNVKVIEENISNMRKDLENMENLLKEMKGEQNTDDSLLLEWCGKPCE